MREIGRFSHFVEADLAAGFLASHGIDASVADRHLATVDPLLQTALGGVRVLVPDGQFFLARDLMLRAGRGEFADPDFEPAPSPGPPDATSLLTVAATAALGGGYAGRAYSGARGRLGHRAGLVLVGVCIALVLAAVLGRTN